MLNLSVLASIGNMHDYTISYPFIILLVVFRYFNQDIVRNNTVVIIVLNLNVRPRKMNYPIDFVKVNGCM